MSLFSELKRRNVFRVAAAYGVLAWLVLQITDVLLDALELPAEHAKIIVLLLVIGAIPALVFSWVYEMTPEGLRKESEIPADESITAHTARKLDVAVIVLLLIAIGMFVVDRIVGERALESAPTGTEAAAPPIPDDPPAVLEASVAVLPFTTRSADADDVFFSDGVHDDLLTQLAKIGELKVISRTSVMEYRDTTKNMRQIGAELGVATIVEGAVQRAGDMVRITAQLIDTETDEHLWAETYDRELTATNLFAIQTDIATAIASALQATLSPAEEAALSRQYTDDLAALESYHRARRYLQSFSVEDVRRGIDELAFAISRDPGFAAAYALRARFSLWAYWLEDSDPGLLDEAWVDIERARAIDPDLPEAHIAEGVWHYWGHLDYERALAALAPALAAYPNDTDLITVFSWVNRRYGRFDEALTHMRRAIELDPRRLESWSTLGETLLAMGQYDEVPEILAAMDRIQVDSGRALSLRAGLALQVDGDSAESARYWDLAADDLAFANLIEWRVRLAAGDYDRALQLSGLIGTVRNRAYVTTSAALRGLVLRVQGDPRSAGELATARTELETLLAAEDLSGAVEIALCQVVGAQSDAGAAVRYCEAGLANIGRDAFDHQRTYMSNAAGGLAMAGEHDRAFELLEQAIQGRVGARRNELRYDALLRDLHDDPRWDDLLARAQP